MHQWVGIYQVGRYRAYPTDDRGETCTDHTDRIRADCNVLTNPGTRMIT